MKVDVYSKVGSKKGEVTLSKAVFGVDINADQLKTAYNRYWANIRTNNARVLSRGEVSGGGRKPWRQKGTGRARFGSSRNPIWRHGGVAFGPSGIENYSKSMPKSMIRSSIKQALSASISKIKVIEAFSVSKYSTKGVVSLIDKIGIEGLILIVAAKLDEKFIASARNIAGVKLLPVNQLNVSAILDADAILIDTNALNELDNWLAKTSKKPVVSGVKK
jgi:large subunit ribosomal protein L4